MVNLIKSKIVRITIETKLHVLKNNIDSLDEEDKESVLKLIESYDLFIKNQNGKPNFYEGDGLEMKYLVDEAIDIYIINY